MLLNKTTIDTIVKGLSLTFKETFGAFGKDADPNYLAARDFVMDVTSTSSIEEHVWIDGIPGFREWLGERVIQNMNLTAWAVKNKKYEKTLGLKVEDIEDGKIGGATVATQNMAADAALLPYDLGVSTLTTNDAWADGSNFYLANRTYGSNTIKNLFSGSSTGTLTSDNFNTVVATMQGFKHHGDKPFGVRPALLVCGPTLRATAWNIVVNSKSVSSSAAVDNPNKDLVALKVCPEITDSSWYLLGAYRMIKGVCLQTRVPVQYQTNYNENADWNSDLKFLKDEILYGARFRGRAFKVAPHLIIKGDGT